MPRPTGSRHGRLDLRATREEKRVLAAAAAYQQLDVTSFIMRAALQAARAVVDRHRRILLSQRDTERILDLLENPPSPPPALLAAARNRRSQTRG